MSTSDHEPSSHEFTTFPAIVEDDGQDQVEIPGFLGGFIGRFFRSNTEPKQIGVDVQAGVQAGVEVQATNEERASPNGSIIHESSSSRDISPRLSRNDDIQSVDSLSLATATTPENKFTRVTSFFQRNRTQKLIDYDKSDHKRYWMPDSTGKECYECHEKFTTFRRKHHCRLCGQIFCAKCSNMHINGARLGYTGMLRVCGYCASNVDKFLASSNNPSIEERNERSQSPNTTEDALGTSTDTLNSAGIATVSNGTIWSSSHNSDSLKNDSMRTQSETNLARSTKLTDSPSMLCVQKLAMQEYERFLINGNKALGSSFELAEDDNEPEWVKKISVDMRDSMKDFTSVECQAYEIQPCINEPEETPNDEQDSPRKISPKLSGIEENGEISKDVDLQQLFDRKMSDLLDFLFEREQIEADQWKDVIWNLSKEVVKTIKNDVRRGDSMNILKYVHIKKLYVDVQTPDYKVVHGVVCTKNLAHTEMFSALDNVSIMTLAGSIEYERVLEKLSSLEPIMIQESEYLKNQVNRITARRISLLLVENSVAKLAGDMLLESQVAVATNVKKTVLERISRSTNADIITSVDAQYIQPQIGFCPRFHQVVVTLKNGSKKIIMVFDECDGEKGLSILLRASSMRELKAAKKILNFMILMRYSSNLEIEFLKMLNTYAVPRSPKCAICLMNQECNEEEDQAEDNFLHALEHSQLTNSPFIIFAPPYLETSKGRKCYLRSYFKKPLFHFYSREDFQSFKNKENELQDQLSKLDSELDDLKLKIAAQEHRLMLDKKVTMTERDRVISFRARSSLLFRARYQKKKEIEAEIKERAEIFAKDQVSIVPCISGANIDVLNPYNHQRIVFLYSAFSRKSANTSCLGPWEFFDEVRFFGTWTKENLSFCFNEEYKCNACDKSMIEHQRKIVHKHARIEITTQIYVKAGSTEGEGEVLPPSFATTDSETILAWRRCQICKANSSVVQVKSGAWHMSFAKFVDYLANSIYCCSPLLTNLPQDCDHCTFHEHQHYFSCNKFITCFKVRPLHVVFSPILCKIEPMTIFCQAVILKKQDLILEADGVFQQAESLLESQEGQVIDHLKGALMKCRNEFEVLLGRIDPEKRLENTHNMPSSDRNYLKAIDTITLSRVLLYAFINEWNTIRTSTDLTRFTKKSSSLTLENGHSGHPHGSRTTSNSDMNVQPTDPTSDMLLIVETAIKNSPNASPSASTTNLSVKDLKESLLQPLNNPFSKALHLELPLNEEGTPLVVKDMIDFKGNTHPDIGSIIAYALSSKEYMEKKRSLQDSISDDDRPLTLRSSMVNGNTIGNDARSHIELDFSDSRAQYFVKVYFADRFDLLRKVIFVDGEDAFLRSLSTSSSWHPQGGKSGASFFRTQDERFVFKQMSRFEVECFKKCAHNYFDYIYTAVTEKKLTALCKIYGVFRVGYTSKSSSQQLKMDVLVMEYLFYKKNVKQLWDLKGSLRNRYASPKSAMPVLLDENLVQDLWGNQIYVHPYSKASLNQAISNDSHFLSSQDIMDYSLLAGICEENNEVIIGIVDYMRTYTLDKKVESMLKQALPVSHLPTVVSPEIYCQRFCEAIDLYFPIAPDQWTGLDSSMNGIL